MDGRGDEVVSERVHRHQRRQLARVAEVIGEGSARQGGAGGGLAGEHVDLATGDLLAQEREGEPGEVRPAAEAADDDIGKGTSELHLRERLLPDHRLVQKDVIEDASQRVRGVVAAGGVLDRLRDRNAEAARRVGMLLEDGASALGLVGRGGDDSRAPGLHQRAPERLLVVGDANHVDLALEPEQPAGKGKRAAPLAGARLRRQPGAAFLLVVVGLRHRRVRLVAPGRADALVLVEDP